MANRAIDRKLYSIQFLDVQGSTVRRTWACRIEGFFHQMAEFWESDRSIETVVISKHVLEHIRKEDLVAALNGTLNLPSLGEVTRLSRPRPKIEMTAGAEAQA